MITQLNKVELIGMVVDSTVERIEDKDILKLALLTVRILDGTKHHKVVDLTWHRVIALQNEKMPKFDQIKESSFVHIIGRIKQSRVMDGEQVAYDLYEILANSIEILPEIAYAEEDK